MFTYTLEEVKSFLGSKSNAPASLRKGLERKGFKVSVKKGNFILETELKQETTLEDVLGFKPSRPNTTYYVVKVLMEGEFRGTYRELAETIKTKYDVEFSEDSVGRAYRELVKEGLALSSTEAKQFDMKELRVNGSKITEEDKVAFFNSVNKARETLEKLSLPDEDIKRLAWKSAVNENGQLYSVPFKLLNFTPEHEAYFKS